MSKEDKTDLIMNVLQRAREKGARRRKIRLPETASTESILVSLARRGTIAAGNRQSGCVALAAARAEWAADR